MYTLKLLESIVSLSWLVLLLVVAIFGITVYNNNSTFPAPNLESISGIVSNEENSSEFSDTPNLDNGKALFKNNCATCHNKNMKDDLTGPALGGVKERWAKYPKEDLYSWIRNSQKLVSENHPQAVAIWNKWEGVKMTSFPNLSDEDIEAILVYIGE